MRQNELYHEDDLVMISALQHYIFCPRQCALIHLEQQWVENKYTVEGRILHEKVHTSGREFRNMVRVEYDMPIRSFTLGLTGKADIVEFHRSDLAFDTWVPYPVEYKRGRPKKDKSDLVQLCAQAICLEEMLGLPVNEGAFYYGKKRRRQVVKMDEELRDITRLTAQALHQLCRQGKTPLPEYNKKCDNCSLIHICLPKSLTQQKKITHYLKKLE